MKIQFYVITDKNYCFLFSKLAVDRFICTDEQARSILEHDLPFLSGSRYKIAHNLNEISTIIKKKPLKVFLNKAVGEYVGGMLLVAANDCNEAHLIAMGDKGLEMAYWEPDYEADYARVPSNDAYYKMKNWEEIKGMSYFGYPGIIAEDSYGD